MLSGALWAKASSALTDLKENISSALENLDKGDGQDSQEDNELEAYKSLLEEAQIQQVELSKQSSVVIAQKEAEITHWKKLAEQNGASVAPSSPSGTTSALKLEKLKAENEMLESSVSQLEDQLKTLLKPTIDAKVLEKQLFIIERKYEACKNDLVALRRDLESREKTKGETIDNLVLEYSKLAAESEQRQMQDAQVIKALEKKKYVYETKLSAMEHSLAEFADRATSSTTSKDSNDGSAHGSSVTKVEALSGLLEASKLANTALSKKLKDKDDEISKLAALSASTTSSSDDNAAVTKLKTILGQREAELTSTQERCSELEKELQKSKDIAKQAVNVVANVKAELAGANAELAALKGAGADSNNENLAGAAEAARLEASYKAQISEFEGKLAEKQTEIAQLKVLIFRCSSACLTYTVKFQEMINELTASSIATKAECAKKVAELQARVEQSQSNETAANGRIQELSNQIQANLAASQSGEDESVRLITAQMQAMIDTEKHSQALLKEQILKNETEWKQALTTAETSLAEQQAAHKTALAAEVARADTACANAVVAEQARMESLLLEQRVKHEAELANLNAEHLATVHDIDSRHSAYIAELKEGHEAALNAEKSEFAKMLLEEQGRSAELIAEERARHSTLLAEMESNHSILLDRERAGYAATIAQLQASTESSLQALKSAHEQEIAGVMANHAAALAQAVADGEAAVNAERAASLTALSEEHSRAEAVLLEEKSRSTADLAAERSQASEILERTVATTRADAEKILAESLQQQMDDLLSQKMSELNQLQTQCDHAKLEALRQLEVEKAAELGELRSELTAVAAQLTHDLEVKTQELAAASAKFEEQLASALAELTVQKGKEQELAVAAVKAECDTVVAGFKAERDEFQQMYLKENKLRKTIHNKLLEIQGNIRVICRVRPVLEVERRSGEGVDVTEFPPSGEELIVQRDVQSKTRFEFDRVFAQFSEQDQVFESVGPLCVSALDGYNVCIFAYGQTGSGKTFTMEGSADKPGVSPRAIGQLFAVADERDDSWRYTFTFSMLEIYNESILDLLDRNKDKDKLDIRQTPEGNIVQGLTEVTVSTPLQVADLMAQGQANRAVGAHDMNEHSSRSHSILTIVCRGKNKLDGSTSFGKLHLIDLAGSERVSKTDATGDRLKEAQNINKSLSALGDVISALGNKKATHVPYRNSKLTFLLQVT
jgi:kinesin family protein C2/C3